MKQRFQIVAFFSRGSF